MKTHVDEQATTIPPPTAFRFPVGYHQLHDDPFLNFEINRLFNRVGYKTMLSEMRSDAPKIRTLADWKREFLALADTALSRPYLQP